MIRTAPIRTGRQKRCRNPDCRQMFRAPNTLAKACSAGCALALTRIEKERQFRQETRRMRQRLKTRGDVLKEAQQAFNAYIRERDHDRPCISCGTDNPRQSRGGAWDCGHYRSTGANPELRFCEANGHKQCKQCNSYLSGNVVNYRIGLRQRIGDDELEWLEGHHPPANYLKPDLEQIRDHYRAETRRLRKARERGLYRDVSIRRWMSE